MKHRLLTLTSPLTLRPLPSPIPSTTHRTLTTTTASTPHPQPQQPQQQQQQQQQQPRPHPTKRPLADLSPTELNSYWDTQAPTASQLAYADKVFTPSRHSPIKLWTLAKFRTTPISSTTPEVAFLGRSNVGKSSLLNNLMGAEVCYTSSKPGRTTTMNAFGIGGTKGGESKVVLLDMPGYGKGSRTEWGDEIMKYLNKRKQLRRTFILIDGLHGIKRSDLNMLELFREYAIPHQVIVSKVDKILAKRRNQVMSGVTEANILGVRKSLRDLKAIIQPVGRSEGPPALGEILTCSSSVSGNHGDHLGMSAIRWAILAAAGYDGRMEVRVDRQSDGEGGSIAADADVPSAEAESKRETRWDFS
ncbi:hypothetical protein BO70DRAFT_385578 [Aspergillus heteromorphus CBS 117.55]|uniref:GTP-binding protein 8 n=1 Tax=Aspergillus heteromorphus CBS 117.55 TaxID=1448321 RepID=A0A317WT91_9EURO|nr:uncharacterized protein BO70DRAFT_385578 [Aspergillus heteromorphus CBS 117.55]PWY88407.1 hypothetical protein BO70DRAFT_385578 [Aspergillus heteromorphus CBS 117.55]